MQQSVDALADQLSQLSTLQHQNEALRGLAEELQTTIQKRDIQLRQHQEQLKMSQQTMARHVRTIHEQQAAIGSQEQRLKEQADAAAEQASQLLALQRRLDDSLDAALLGLDPGAVSTKVAAAVKSAMTGSHELKALHPTLGQMPDALVREISTTLTRCCAEMYLQLKQSARNEPPTAIQVPCC
jgi:predicted RNase H-like nuclease (RuvC/YqgF family)